MFVSPWHLHFSLPSVPLEQWEVSLMVELFHARTDGWHLEVADRCINGWRDEQGGNCIQSRHLDGRQTNHIPDSGWAVLQIALNYFETVAFFKLGGNAAQAKSYELFIWGVFDVFPDHKNRKPNIAKHLYSDLRTGLYHGGINKGKTSLRHTNDSPPIEGDGITGIVRIDPHRFIPVLRNHLNDYCNTLMDESNADLRHKFRAAFLDKYG